MRVQWNPWIGARVGEAANPRPESNAEIRFAVSKRTAIHQKSDLISDMDVDVIALSETSATQKVMI